MKELMLGNEAVARGLFEAGVRVDVYKRQELCRNDTSSKTVSVFPKGNEEKT